VGVWVWGLQRGHVTVLQMIVKHVAHLLLHPSTSSTLLKISPARVSRLAASDLQGDQVERQRVTVGLQDLKPKGTTQAQSPCRTCPCLLVKSSHQHNGRPAASDLQAGRDVLFIFGVHHILQQRRPCISAHCK
jgi:hypothetical protein